ncbi:hypothetical protein AB0K89_18895 [Streptomyces cinnamoneus]|uniref:hypothetical protein n=1 Tax=Streptomyces cinnamoneus TaxID=53446 RepID=UPI0034274B57
MISRARRMLYAGAAGAVSVVMGFSALGVAAADASPAADDEVPPTGVETFEYPDADKILKERGIVLRKGDGHIMLADCAVSNDITIMTSKKHPGQNPPFTYCFKVTGAGNSGYLNLEVPETFNVMTAGRAVRATATVGEQKQIVDVNKARSTAAIGEGFPGQDGNTAILVELRLIG